VQRRERENGRIGKGGEKMVSHVVQRKRPSFLLNVLIHCRRILLIRTSFITHLIDVIPRRKPQNALEEKGGRKQEAVRVVCSR
jgi:hypothetical protein